MQTDARAGRGRGVPGVHGGRVNPKGARNTRVGECIYGGAMKPSDVRVRGAAASSGCGRGDRRGRRAWRRQDLSVRGGGGLSRHRARSRKAGGGRAGRPGPQGAGSSRHQPAAGEEYLTRHQAILRPVGASVALLPCLKSGIRLTLAGGSLGLASWRHRYTPHPVLLMAQPHTCTLYLLP